MFYKEILKQVVRRIANEELNVNVRIERLLGHIGYPSEEKEGGSG